VTTVYLGSVWIFTKENYERQIIMSMIPPSIKYRFKLKIKSSTK
jgi:hypothetical protein